MAVREFVASSSDEIVFAAGSLSGMRYGTVGVIALRNSSGAWHAHFYPHDSSNNFLGGTQWSSDDFWNWYAAGHARGPAVSTVIWYVGLVRKATGTIPPRYSVYDYDAGTWTHADGATSRNDWLSPGLEQLRMSFEGTGDFPDMRIAVMAAWNGSLPWSADATGDAAIEAAGLETSAANWLDANPDALWRFNQDSTSTAVVDDTGNGADQTSISGTNVVIGDDPPGFDFSLTAGTPYGRTTETETARAWAASKAAAVGRAAETAAARAFGLARAYATGRTTETETARGFTAAKSVAAGRATETETARAFGAQIGVGYGRVAETETPRSFVPAKTTDLGRTAETEAARAFTAVLGHAYGRVVETETVRGFAPTLTLGRVTETETARAFSASGIADLNPVELTFTESASASLTEPSRALLRTESAALAMTESAVLTHRETA